MNKLFKQAIKNDYYTPRIKAEVIFDTLLTPFIEEIVGSELNKKDLILVAKEFPLFSSTISTLNGVPCEKSKRSICIDYLLMDQSTLYLIELKTDNQSFSIEQLARYSILKNSKKSNTAEFLYEDFISLLCYSKKAKEAIQNFENEKKLITIGIDAEILAKVYGEKLVETEEQLIVSIKNRNNNRKYLWQLYKMLESSGKNKIRDIFEKENKGGFKNLEIIYIVPKKTSSDESTLGAEIVIELNELVNKKIEFNYREKGYLNRTKEEFDTAWDSFQEIWKSLNLQ